MVSHKGGLLEDRLFFVNFSDLQCYGTFFYEDCEYCQEVFETIAKLKISDEFTFKDIRLNPDYAKELVDLTGNVTVPCLINEQGPMKEAKDIRKYLVSHFD